MAREIYAYECTECGTLHYPFRMRCRNCGELEPFQFKTVPLPKRGKLLTFTKVYNLPAEYEVATLGLGMLTPSLASHRSELFPTRVRATAAGWITNVAIGGSIVGFVIGALIVDQVGLSTTITALSAGLVIAMLLVTRLPETRGMDLVRSRAGRSAATKAAPQTEPASSQPAPTTPPPAPTNAPAQPQAPPP